MNRAQRRKAGIKKKTATYNFTQEQLRAAISEGMEEYKDKIREEVTNQALRVIAYVPLLVLHDKWGFGKKRLEKFLFEFAEQIDCLEKDYVGFEDMISVIKDETDLDVSEYIKF
ncbi:hypothetical protein HMPREF9489_0602 [Finegoldia magna SY403409CC001050417]|uniref:Uncharacterized protein n=1 Tax=Finegoldia magna TaxID=1260 RepID=A0A7D4JM72_FINMA|nr:hypothetical protein [Finegoldia magna]EGS34218.1 hypothetical protein HMPREF9489_0602 [Finegoldia magna SY403409CC001050417]QKH79720.1 hypothetical protein FOC70_04890 [Finegoldia magna]QKH79764.1 hypothetical protein FOC70_05150 [Finegoldia magna]